MMTTTSLISLWWAVLGIYSLNNFQIYHPALLTTVMFAFLYSFQEFVDLPDNLLITVLKAWQQEILFLQDIDCFFQLSKSFPWWLSG